MGTRSSRVRVRFLPGRNFRSISATAAFLFALASAQALAEIKATPSASQAVNGSVIRVDLELTPTVNPESVTAKFDGVDVPVVPLKKPGADLAVFVGVPFTRGPGKVK